MTRPPEFVCHARRHMTASEFRTYDTIRIMVMSGPHDKDASLLFYGKLTKLANYNNTSPELEAINIASLIEKGWLLRMGKQRWRGGRWGTVQYILVEHDDYANITEYMKKSVPGWQACPPYRYDMETGRKLSSGKQPNTALVAVNVAKQRKKYRSIVEDGKTQVLGLPDAIIDVIIARQKAKKQK
jgi:hypothetical protein